MTPEDPGQSAMHLIRAKSSGGRVYSIIKSGDERGMPILYALTEIVQARTVPQRIEPVIH